MGEVEIDDLREQVNLPIDADGYTAFRCPSCTRNFKLHSGEVDEHDANLGCPYCGLDFSLQELFHPEVEDAIDRAVERLANDVEQRVADSLVDAFQQGAGSSDLIDIEVESKSLTKPQPKVMAPIPGGEVWEAPCCDKHVKVDANFAGARWFCPYCGEER